MNLGTRLKSTLEARGMTVTQFAKEASIPAQTIYALINRDSNKADMDILLKLLKALHTDFFTFMGEAPQTDGTSVEIPAPPAAGAATQPSEKIVEKVVEKVLVKEVPTPAPEGKAAVYIDSDTYEQVLSLAKEEGIEDADIIAQVFQAYIELGFGYRQRPLRSIIRDYIPKAARSGDMDSFLL